MSEPFTFTLTTPSEATLTLTEGVNATFTLNPAASHATLAEWIAAEAVLYLDAAYPTGL